MFIIQLHFCYLHLKLSLFENGGLIFSIFNCVNIFFILHFYCFCFFLFFFLFVCFFQTIALNSAFVFSVSVHAFAKRKEKKNDKHFFHT